MTDLPGQLTLFDTLPPAQRNSPTSVAAAVSIAPTAGTLRAKVLLAIRAAGAVGLTDEEGIDALGMPASTYRPRRVECVQGQLVRDSNTTRTTRSGRQAVVWVVAESSNSNGSNNA